jgi:hypothetical protein
MATHDLGHTLTDKKLLALERRIARLYAQAGRELQETIDAYFEQFAKRDEEMRTLIGEIVNGKEWTEQDYKQWRLAQIGRGELPGTAGADCAANDQCKRRGDFLHKRRDAGHLQSEPQLCGVYD